jgi:hypothetical protein
MCRPDHGAPGLFPFLEVRRLTRFLPLCSGKMIRRSKERLVRRLWHISPQPRARAVSSSRVLAEANLALLRLSLMTGSVASWNY